MCVGPGPRPGVPSRLPLFLDRRLKRISVTHYDIDRHKTTTVTPNVVHLNLSHNKITELEPFAIQAPSLRVLDFSYNLLTEVSSIALPTAGTLDRLYLTGNDIRVYAPLALSAAMSRCYVGGSVDESTLIADSGMVLEAPGCSLGIDAGVAPGQNTSRYIVCIETKCDQRVQLNPRADCPDSSLTSQEYKRSSRCDQILDCFNGADEADCTGEIALVGLESDNSFGICDAVSNYFEPEYNIRYGMATLTLTPPGRLAFGDVQYFYIPILQEGFQYRTERSTDFISAANFTASVGDQELVFDVDYTLSFLPGQILNCKLTYSVSSVTQTTTPMSEVTTRPAPAAADSGNDSGSAVAAAAGGAAAGLMCILLIVVLLLRRRTRGDKALERALEMEVRLGLRLAMPALPVSSFSRSPPLYSPIFPDGPESAGAGPWPLLPRLWPGAAAGGPAGALLQPENDLS